MTKRRRPRTPPQNRSLPGRPRRPVVILDTNLWSYLAETNTPDEVAARFDARGITVAIPPISLIEALSTPDQGKRARLVQLLTDHRWKKLPSEAELLAAEFVTAVRQLRPDWLRALPITDRSASWHTYWTRVFWREARADPAAVAHRFSADRDVRDFIVGKQLANRPGWPVGPGQLQAALNSVVFPDDHPDPDPGSRLGWPADTAAAYWRVDNRDVWWHQLGVIWQRSMLTREDATYADWVGAYVNLAALVKDRAGFNRFWLFDVDGTAVPRNWWQGTLSLLQLGTKIGSGNPGDVALITHIVDCNCFLSADGRLIRAVDAAQRAAPFPVTTCGQVRPSAQGWLAAVESSLPA